MGEGAERTWFKDREVSPASNYFFIQTCNGKYFSSAQAEKKTKKLSRNKRKVAMEFEDEDAVESYKAGEFILREAKRKRRPQKIRAFDEDDGNVPKGKKRSKKGGSAFDDDLTNTKRQNVKRLRHKGNARGGRAAAKR